MDYYKNTKTSWQDDQSSWPSSPNPAVKFYPTLLELHCNFSLFVTPPHEKAKPLTPPAPPSSDTHRHHFPWSPLMGRAWGRRGMTALLVCLTARSRSPAAPADLSPAPSIPLSRGRFGTKYSLQIHFFLLRHWLPGGHCLGCFPRAALARQNEKPGGEAGGPQGSI